MSRKLTYGHRVIGSLFAIAWLAVCLVASASFLSYGFSEWPKLMGLLFPVYIALNIAIIFVGRSFLSLLYSKSLRDHQHDSLEFSSTSAVATTDVVLGNFDVDYDLYLDLEGVRVVVMKNEKPSPRSSLIQKKVFEARSRGVFQSVVLLSDEQQSIGMYKPTQHSRLRNRDEFKGQRLVLQ